MKPLSREPAKPAVWDLANKAAGKQKQPMPFPGATDEKGKRRGLESMRILLSPAGDLLACLCMAQEKGILMINLSDPSTSKWVPTKDMVAREIAASEIAFSDDGALFAAGGGDRVLVWEVSAGGIKLRNAMTLTPFAGKLSELVFAATPDGKAVVVAGSNNGRLSVWDAKTGVPLQAAAHRFAGGLPDGVPEVEKPACRRRFVWKGNPVGYRRVAARGTYVAIGADSAYAVLELCVGRPCFSERRR